MILSFSFSSFAATSTRDVVYGEDNRKDVFESTDSTLVELSRATAAKVATILTRIVGQEAIMRSASLQERGICATEKFAHQPTSSACSGFLVAEDILVTAGHCIKNLNDCKNNRWIFDFRVENAEQTKVRVPAKSVYSCKKILSQIYEDGRGSDYAVIQLDRKVKDRKPLSFRKSGVVEIGADLAAIGHPSGLPTKIADGGKVRSVTDKYFVANLDTFVGNSGSAVINTKTSEVEGILVRGETDYIDNTELGCKVVNVCETDGCRGEDVQLITEIPELKNL